MKAPNPLRYSDMADLLLPRKWMILVRYKHFSLVPSSQKKILATDNCHAPYKFKIIDAPKPDCCVICLPESDLAPKYPVHY